MNFGREVRMDGSLEIGGRSERRGLLAVAFFPTKPELIHPMNQQGCV